MKKILPFIIAVTLILSGCTTEFAVNSPEASATAAPEYSFTRETFPALAGSFSTLPMAEAVASIMLGETREAVSEFLHFGNTAAAYRMLSEGSCGLVLAVETANAVDNLDTAEVARDALVFYVSRENPINNLSSEQLRDIYSAKVQDWSELGGTQRTISAFQRNEWSGAQMAFLELLMKNITAKEPVMDYITMTDGTLAGAVAVFDGAEGSIGFSTLFAAEQMGVAEGYKIISVDGIFPSAETIASGEYPLILKYAAAIRSDSPKGSPERILWDWLQDGSGRAFVAAQGYVR